MSLISFTSISDGSTATASQVNTPLTTIYDDYNGNITDANISASAAIAISKLAATAWSSWTPTWTNLTTGNGTNSSKYTQIGKTTICRLEFVLGSTSSVSGSVSFSLPVTAATVGAGELYGKSLLVETGTYEFTGTVEVSSTTSALLYVDTVSGSHVVMGAVSSTVPFTWGSGHKISAILIFEAA